MCYINPHLTLTFDITAETVETYQIAVFN